MLTPVTLIEELVEARLSSDQMDCLLHFRDIDRQAIKLGLPVASLPAMIDHLAAMLSMCARDGHDVGAKLLGTSAVFPTQWWNVHRDAAGGAILVLTLESGSKLAFTFPADAITALRDTLAACEALNRNSP